tara:strand:+ start:7255 stop:8064 length:810 start_codon:yes stop_codon:yes gene_type:complete
MKLILIFVFIVLFICILLPNTTTSRKLLREQLKWVEIKQYGKKFDMAIHEKDGVSDWIQDRKKVYCEDNILNQILQSSDPDSVFLDIGSNIGSCALLAAALGFKSYAFEPNPINFKLLEASIKKNHFESLITLIKCGASNVNEEFDLFYLPDNKGHGMINSFEPRLASQYIKTKGCVKTVDSVVPESVNVNVIKIDTEGHEEHVIKGMSNLLLNKNRRPYYINYEVNPEALAAQKSSSKRIRELIQKMKYNLNPSRKTGLRNEEAVISR